MRLFRHSGKSLSTEPWIVLASWHVPLRKFVASRLTLRFEVRVKANQKTSWVYFVMQPLVQTSAMSSEAAWKTYSTSFGG